MNSLKTRFISGAIFVTIVFLATYFSIYSFFGIFLVINILGILEMNQLSRFEFNTHPLKLIGILMAITLFTASFIFELTDSPILYFLLYLEIILCFIVEIYRNKPNTLYNLSHTFFTIIFFTLPLSFLNLMLEDNGNFDTHIILFILIIIWIYDSSAYLIGAYFGKHKLFKRISPKKSWEGLLGGSFITLIITYFLTLHFESIYFPHSFIIALLVIVFGTFSDLYASLIKRSVNIKDFGSILPGHGGIIDRVDTMLLSVPAIFIYLKISDLI